jgi:glutaminyl-tRNA synthetase
MPAKFDPASPENAVLIDQFTALGLSPNAATALVRQPKSSTPFKALIDEFNLTAVKLDEKAAGALVKLSASSDKLGSAEKGFAITKIVKGDIKSADQVSG